MARPRGVRDETFDRPLRGWTAGWPVAAVRSGNGFLPVSRGLFRRKHIGVALLVLCGTYSGGLLALSSPVLFSGSAKLAAAFQPRDMSPRGGPLAPPVFAQRGFAQAALAELPRIQLPAFAFPMAGVAGRADRTRAVSDRLLAAATLRKASDRVLAGFGSNMPGILSVSLAQTAAPDAAQPRVQQRSVAAYLPMQKSGSAFGARPWDFGETQKVMSTEDAAALALAAEPEDTCGLSAGRQNQNSHHGQKRASLIFNRRAAGASSASLFRLPIVNWKWCNL
jgi:hypothetical protein